MPITANVTHNIQRNAPSYQGGMIRSNPLDWTSTAQVTFNNMTVGNTYRIGWVQVLATNKVTAIYDDAANTPDRHRCELRRTSQQLPVLDSISQHSAPWYDHLNSIVDVQILRQGVQMQPVTMRDNPSDGIDPFCLCPHSRPNAPLIEIRTEQSFRGWVAVKNITRLSGAEKTGHQYQNTFDHVLYCHQISFEQKIRIDTSKQGFNMIVGHQTTHKVDRMSPELHIPPCVWRNQIALTNNQDTWVHTGAVRG